MGCREARQSPEPAIYSDYKLIPGLRDRSRAIYVRRIKVFVLTKREEEGRILELHSPDGVHECWLRAADNTEANVWFNALHSALAALTLKALRLASALPDPQQLQHIGWLARRHCLQVREVIEHSPKEEVCP
ncbi:hypothetical protein P5V15_000367 [Pogonomyrmex californicus]